MLITTLLEKLHDKQVSMTVTPYGEMVRVELSRVEQNVPLIKREKSVWFLKQQMTAMTIDGAARDINNILDKEF